MTKHDDILTIYNEESMTYKDTISYHLVKWLKTMKFEIDSMYVIQVWTLVDSYERIKPIECKYAFKKKTNMGGNVCT